LLWQSHVSVTEKADCQNDRSVASELIRVAIAIAIVIAIAIAIAIAIGVEPSDKTQLVTRE